jgi:carboxylesterase type B
LFVFRTLNGVPFTSFFGIKYAQAPRGDLFLQRPVAALPWNGTFVADEEVTCLQVMRLKNKPRCLIHKAHLSFFVSFGKIIL